MSQKKVTVIQTRSQSGSTKGQIATLKALGLGRIGKSKSLPVNDCIRGMVKRVSHLVDLKIED